MFLTAYRDRTCTYTITINDADGDAVTVAASDVVRVKIGREGETPLLDLDSAAAASGGSTLTTANPTLFKFDQDDVATLPKGVYNIEVGIVDDSDSDLFKHAEKGVIAVHGTQTGDKGLT